MLKVIKAPYNTLFDKVSGGFVEKSGTGNFGIESIGNNCFALIGSGTTFIELPFKPTQKTRIIITAKFASLPATPFHLFMFSNSEASANFFSSEIAYAGSVYLNYNPYKSFPNIAPTNGWLNNVVYTIDYNKNSLKINDEVFSFNAQNFTSPSNLKLFTNADNSTILSSDNKIYSIKIYEDDVLMYDLIPVAENTPVEFNMVPDQAVQSDTDYGIIITEFETGAEQRRKKRDNPKNEFNLSFTNQSGTKKNIFVDFVNLVSGPLYPFLWENPNDNIKRIVRFKENTSSIKKQTHDLYSFGFNVIEVNE